MGGLLQVSATAEDILAHFVWAHNTTRGGRGRADCVSMATERRKSTARMARQRMSRLRLGLWRRTLCSASSWATLHVGVEVIAVATVELQPKHLVHFDP